MTSQAKVDPSDPQVKKLVYNMYRGMLVNYNDKANDIVAQMPSDLVSEDQGIYKQLESIVRQTSNLSGGGSPATPPSAPSEPFAPSPPASSTGNGSPGSPPMCPPPPPPPPPGSLPSLRISSEINPKGQPRPTSGVPPLAIQNAMLTKDKKPFTYTPGGIDLSEIRSPRMQKRISRNAMCEGVTNDARPAVQPPPSGPPQPLPPQAMAAMQPQMAVPVFPQGAPMLPPLVPPPPPPPAPVQRAPSPPPPPLPTAPPPVLTPTSPKVTSPVSMTPKTTAPPPPSPITTTPKTLPPPPRPVPKSTPTSPQSPPSFRNEPGSIYVPLVVGSRPQSHAQVGSIYIPIVAEDQTQAAPVTPTPQSPMYQNLNKAPMPWMNSQARQTVAASGNQQQQPPQSPPWVNQQQQPQPQSPPWVVNQSQRSPPSHQPQARVTPMQREEKVPQQNQASGSQTRIIPIQVEGRSPQVQANRPGGQQQQQNRGGPTQVERESPGARIIPVQVEGHESPKAQPPWQQQRRPSPGQNIYNTLPGNLYSQQAAADIASGMNNLNMRDQSGAPMRGPADPLQSRSFRILQKFTDADEPGRPVGNSSVPSRPYHTLPKMPLSDDDRQLMNMFRAQVSEDLSLHTDENPLYRGGHIPSKVFRILDDSVDEGSYLHSEVDPRYRGPNIPSRAFRVLQTMTDSGNDVDVPRGSGAQPQQRGMGGNQREQESVHQVYVHPSQQQQVPEPKKYMGGKIPSRSFRMLQAMTPQEDCETVRSETLDKGKDTQQTENAQEQFESHLRGQCDLPSSFGPSPNLGAASSSPTAHNDPYDEFMWDPYSYMYAYPYLYPEYWYPTQFSIPAMQQQQRRSFIPSKSFQYLQKRYDNFHGYCDYFPDGFGEWFEGDYTGEYNNGAFDDWGMSVEVAPKPRDYRPDVPPEGFFPSRPHNDAGEQNQHSVNCESESQEETTAESVSHQESAKLSNERTNITKEKATSHVDHQDDYSIAEISTSDDCHSCVEGLVEEPLSSASEHGDSSCLTAQSVKDTVELKDEVTIRTDDDDSSDESTESNNTEDESEEGEKNYAVQEPREEAETVECGDEWQFVRSQCCRHRVPRQLSVIYEESEHSAVSDTDSSKGKKNALRQQQAMTGTFDEREEDTLHQDDERNELDSDATMENHSAMDSDSSTTLASGNHSEDESDDTDVDEDSTVTVRLPLKLKFSKSANEEVATLIVGNSKIEVDKSDKVEGEMVGKDSVEVVAGNKMGGNTDTFQSEAEETAGEEDASAGFNVKACDETSSQNDESSSDETDSENEDDALPITANDISEKRSEKGPTTSTSGKIDNDMNDLNITEEDVQDSPTVNSNDVATTYDTKGPDSQKPPKGTFQNMALEALLWHFRRYLQENLGSEDDSGVTDMSRQLSDVETDTEGDKRAAIKCQRAKTHSRLFELLQEELKQSDEICEDEELLQDENAGNKEDLDRATEQQRRRKLLNLPVGPLAETASSSGIISPSLASPTSPTTRERLIAELIQELQRRQGTRTAPPLKDVFQWMQEEFVHTQGENPNPPNGYAYYHQPYDGGEYFPEVYYHHPHPQTNRTFKFPNRAARCPRAGSPVITNTAKCTNNNVEPSKLPASSSTSPPPEDSTNNTNTQSTSATS